MHGSVAAGCILRTGVVPHRPCAGGRNDSVG